jgi:DNA helicase II / ATP-dependent DNA helicase PcrA
MLKQDKYGATMDNFTQFLDNGLNPQQKKAVVHTTGPLVIIAGAGSGKTRIITARIGNLIINHNVHPSGIVALTFTNKAAREMKQRIASFSAHDPSGLFIGTFHAYCLSLLKKNSDLLVHPFVSVLSQDDQERMIKRILEKNNLQKTFSARAVMYQISTVKNSLMLSKKYFGTQQILLELFEAYEEEKRASKCYDFDDLITQAVYLLEHNPFFAQRLQSTIQHMLVDEYQDTNEIQHKLLTLLATRNGTLAIQSICVVGDEDQSIYSWRGATVTNMLNFGADFSDVTKVTIEQNYRSVQPILNVANAIILHNDQRTPKTLWSNKEAHDRVRIVQCDSEYQEGELVAQLAKLFTQREHGHCAILYRTHSQSRIIEEALIRQSIPYTIIGGTQFYERKEIKDLIAYLRLIVNPFDKISFFRVINVPLRGLGSAFEEQLYQHWEVEPFLAFHEILCALASKQILTPAKQRAVQQFLEMFASLDLTTSPLQAITSIVERVCYLTYLQQTYEKDDAQTRIDNVKEFINAIAYFQEQENISTVAQLLDQIALMQDNINDTNKRQRTAVYLMTLHAAKGLEFDTVALVGLEDGLLPSSRSLGDNYAIQEERRLCYVGTTRAQEWLLMTYATNRYNFGQTHSNAPSRFIAEIPQHLSPVYNCSFYQPVALRSFLQEWIFGTTVVPSPTHSRHIEKRMGAASQSGRGAPSLTNNQKVVHKTYGIGTVQDLEVNMDNTCYVTVAFKQGVKKIRSDFLQAAQNENM